MDFGRCCAVRTDGLTNAPVGSIEASARLSSEAIQILFRRADDGRAHSRFSTTDYPNQRLRRRRIAPSIFMGAAMRLWCMTVAEYAVSGADWLVLAQNFGLAPYLERHGEYE
jgi:hypothetical protein